MNVDRGRVAAYALCGAFLLWANWRTPLWADDYCRMLPIGASAPLVLAWHDYWHWSGRFFVTALTYLALQPPAWRLWVFDCLNTAVFLCLVAQLLGLARLAAGRPGAPAGATEIVMAALLVWWLPRSIAEVALWKTGSIGYLWALAGEMWVVRRTLSGDRRPGLLTGVSAAVVATFLEPLSLLVSLLLAAQCARRRRAGLWAPIWLTVAHAAGTVLLLAAPGNFVRAGGLGPTAPADRLIGVIGNLGSLFDPCWLLAATAVGFAVAAPDEAGAWSIRCAASRLQAGRGWMFVVLALLYMAILLGVPRAALAARVSFPASVFLVCYVLAVLQLRPARLHAGRIAAAAGCAVLLAIHLAVVVPELDRLAAIGQGWVAAARAPGAAGTDLVLSPQRVGGRLVYARKSRFFEGITPDPASFVNVCFARALQLRSVVAR